MIKDEFQCIYDFLRNYKITFENGELISIDDHISNYDNFNNWDIRRFDGKKESNKRLKSQCDFIFSRNAATVIEDYFSRNVENYWNTFLEYALKFDTKKTYIVAPKHKDKFLEFFAIQLCRVFENLKEMGIDVALEMVLSYFDDNYIQDEKALDDYKTELCLMQVYKYVKYIKSNNFEFSNNAVSKVIEMINAKMQIAFLIAPSTTYFITTDSPCMGIKFNSRFKQHFGGWFMPVTPQICAYIYRNSSKIVLNKYYIIDISSSNIKYINYMLKESCLKNVVFNQSTIEGLIHDKPDIVSWNKTLDNVGLSLANKNL